MCFGGCLFYTAQPIEVYHEYVFTILTLSPSLHTVSLSTLKIYSFLAHLFTLLDILSFSSTYCPQIYKNTLSAFIIEYLFYSSISDKSNHFPLCLLIIQGRNYHAYLKKGSLIAVSSFT